MKKFFLILLITGGLLIKGTAQAQVDPPTEPNGFTTGTGIEYHSETFGLPDWPESIITTGTSSCPEEFTPCADRTVLAGDGEITILQLQALTDWGEMHVYCDGVEIPDINNYVAGVESPGIDELFLIQATLNYQIHCKLPLTMSSLGNRNLVWAQYVPYDTRIIGGKADYNDWLLLFGSIFFIIVLFGLNPLIKRLFPKKNLFS